jgi:dienelactone hydrolase
MKFRLFISILISAFALQSCTSGTNTKKDKTQKIADSIPAKENFVKGQVIDRVVCKSDASQSYALYLPSTYSLEKKYPIIYAFDPHGTGKLPVSFYKELAEQYGYIIVGSNNSKNGTSWDESQIIASTLFTDAGNRLSINNQRIYLLGFSGGARVANALVANNGFVSGVICCGAAAPAATINISRNNYSFFGIAGNEDFNYTEMKKYDLVDLAGHNIKHALITFNGKHEWPAKDVMADGFLWLELNEMRKNLANKNDSLILNHFQPVLKQIELYQQKKQLYAVYELCRKTINFYDGLVDLSSVIATYKTVEGSPEIDKQLKLEEASWNAEEQLKQYYIKALQTENISWWNKSIGELRQKIKTEKDKNKVLMNKRTLSFLSLAAYMQTSGALKQNNVPAADFYGQLYLLVDPTNNEADYLMASIFAKQGKTKEAVKSLSNAVKNKFVDVTRLQSDSVFNGIKNTKEFEELIKNIK